MPGIPCDFNGRKKIIALLWLEDRYVLLGIRPGERDLMQILVEGLPDQAAEYQAIEQKRSGARSEIRYARGNSHTA